jgi:methyl-accepting chemotaxis protein
MAIKLSVRVKINLIAVIGALGFILYLILNLFSGVATNERLQQLEKQQLPVLLSINSASLHMLKLKDFLSSAISSSEEEMVETAEIHSDGILKELAKIAAFKGDFAIQATKLSQSHVKYWSLAKKLALGMITETVDYDNLANLSQNMNESYQHVNDGLGELRQRVIDKFATTVTTIQSNNTNDLYFGLVVGVIMIAVLVLVAYVIALNITKSILKVAAALNEMATSEADLTRRLDIADDDEVGLLVSAFNGFIASMEKLISQTVTVSGEVTKQARSLHTIAGETHQGIVKQEQEILLVATAVTELSASSAEVATNADSASDLTQKANEETSRSHTIITQNRATIGLLAEEVSRAVNVIDQLHGKTSEIGAMVDVIRAIADQTNLLALNAAIEAARAGEQGRGFAVVADEVRSLASRTQQSTGEIESLIATLQSDATEAVDVMKKGSVQAKESVEQSQNVELALGSINQFVTDINDRTIQVSTASQEQSNVAEELSRNIERINEVAGNTVDKADQTIHASEQLDVLADNLSKLISRFKVDHVSKEDVTVF